MVIVNRQNNKPMASSDEKVRPESQTCRASGAEIQISSRIWAGLAGQLLGPASRLTQVIVMDGLE